MNTKQLLELATRCEREEPSRELNQAIVHACGIGWLQEQEYTTSLDAAVTLVPEACGIELQRYWRRQPGEWWSAVLSWGITGKQVAAEDVATAALALCSAALKARAALSETGQCPTTSKS